MSAERADSLNSQLQPGVSVSSETTLFMSQQYSYRSIHGRTPRVGICAHQTTLDDSCIHSIATLAVSVRTAVVAVDVSREEFWGGGFAAWCSVLSMLFFGVGSVAEVVGVVLAVCRILSWWV